jgi:hypothetical protein
VSKWKVVVISGDSSSSSTVLTLEAAYDSAEELRRALEGGKVPEAWFKPGTILSVERLGTST